MAKTCFRLSKLCPIWHPQRSQSKANTPIDREPSSEIFSGDDRYWYGGFFYSNPDDPALFAEKRYDLGWTLNFGHPQAKLVLIGMLLVPLVFGVILSVLISGAVHIGCHPSGCHLFP